MKQTKPQPNAPVLVSQDRYDEMAAELLHRTHTLRAEIGARVAEARAHGDLSENAEYHSSRDEQAQNEGHIADLEEMIKYAKIIKKSHSDTVQLTSRVTLEKANKHIVYTLVSPAEADIAQGKLSSDSPIGKLIMGKKVGDVFVHTTPAGDVQYTIIHVE
jgi:transcription elongation factor GreA